MESIGKLKIPEVKLLEAHGKCQDLEDRIDRFRYKQANVLIATTVIENGVDMPNVNTIIVYCADRFGMSALYQLRGRVGRCDKQAYAYFLTNNSRTLYILNLSLVNAFVYCFLLIISGIDKPTNYDYYGCANETHEYTD